MEIKYTVELGYNALKEWKICSYRSVIITEKDALGGILSTT